MDDFYERRYAAAQAMAADVVLDTTHASVTASADMIAELTLRR